MYKILANFHHDFLNFISILTVCIINKTHFAIIFQESIMVHVYIEYAIDILAIYAIADIFIPRIP